MPPKQFRALLVILSMPLRFRRRSGGQPGNQVVRRKTISGGYAINPPVSFNQRPRSSQIRHGAALQEIAPRPCFNRLAVRQQEQGSSRGQFQVMSTSAWLHLRPRESRDSGSRRTPTWESRGRCIQGYDTTSRFSPRRTIRGRAREDQPCAGGGPLDA
jgi:hypothetical protein